MVLIKGYLVWGYGEMSEKKGWGALVYMTERSCHRRKQNRKQKAMSNDTSSYLQGKVLLCYGHCGLTVVRVQVQQMVIFHTAMPEKKKKKEMK